jgi:hypothetical protein
MHFINQRRDEKFQEEQKQQDHFDEDEEKNCNFTTMLVTYQ